MKSIYLRCLNVWGIENQLLKTIEELSELQKAIARYLIARYNSIDKMIAKDEDFWKTNKLTNDIGEEIVEEIVDCEIMLNQLKEYFDEKIYAQYRTEKRINLLKLLEELENG